MNKLQLWKKINIILAITSIIIAIIFFIIIGRVNPNDINTQNKISIFLKAYFIFAAISICIMNILIKKAKKKL